MAQVLGVPLYEVVIKGSALKRYFFSILSTFSAIRSENPDVIFFQNPSLVLALFMVLTKPFHRKRLVMDAHNAALKPIEGKSELLNKLAYWIVKKVDITIVTNSILSKKVTKYNGVPFILSDPIPISIISNKNFEQVYPSPYVVFICTWAEDEPYDQVIEAAKMLENKNIVVRITGRPPVRIKSQALGKNVSLEGFVSESKYIQLISGAALAIDLTTRPDCLVCGAYEAAAVGTPCLLTSNSCSIDLFTKGYLFTENDAKSIASKIDEGLNRSDELRSELNAFRVEYSNMLDKRLKELAERIDLIPKESSI